MFPVNVSVPVPVLVRPPLPDKTPESVLLLSVAMALPAPLSVQSLVYVPLPESSSVPLLPMVLVPLPILVSEPMDRVPALIVVPPE